MAGRARPARLAGGGLFLTRYDGPGSISFAAKVPGHIATVDISGGQSYLVHRHGWMCGTPGITPSVALQQSFRGGLYGGEGFVLQKLESEGRAWVELGGGTTESVAGGVAGGALGDFLRG